jgi:hypothetical protein
VVNGFIGLLLRKESQNGKSNSILMRTTPKYFWYSTDLIRTGNKDVLENVYIVLNQIFMEKN